MSIDWDHWLADDDSNAVQLNESDLTEADRKIKAIWECAFPKGLKYREWSQLIYMMLNGDHDLYPLSPRMVARYVGILLNIEHIHLYPVVYGVNYITPYDNVQSWLKQRLIACDYYEWLLKNTEPNAKDIDLLDDLQAELLKLRPFKRLSFKYLKTPFSAFDDQTLINASVRLMMGLDSEWAGVEWHSLEQHVMWEQVVRILQYNRDRTTRYMSRKEAHAFTNAFTKLLNNGDPSPMYFTNHNHNGFWMAITSANWQYWMVSSTRAGIAVVGFEED